MLSEAACGHRRASRKPASRNWRSSFPAHHRAHSGARGHAGHGEPPLAGANRDRIRNRAAKCCSLRRLPLEFEDRSARAEFRWIAGRQRDGGRRAISRRTQGSRGAFRRGSGQLDHKTMTSKSDVTTLKPPAPASSGGADFAAQWTEARHAYPLYAALATQFNSGPLPHPAGELPPERPSRETFDTDLQWLDGIDERVRAFQIRQLPPEILNASEESAARVSAAPVAQTGKDHRRSRQDRFAAGAVFRVVRAGRTVPQRNSPGGRRGSPAAGADCGRCHPRWNGASRSTKFWKRSPTAKACAT